MFRSFLLVCQRSFDGHRVHYALNDKIPLHLCLIRHHLTGNNLESDFPPQISWLGCKRNSLLAFKSLHPNSFEFVRLDTVGAFVIVCASFEDKNRWLGHFDSLTKKTNTTIDDPEIKGAFAFHSRN